MAQGAFGLVGEALKFSIGQGARNFGVLSFLMLFAVAAGWGAVFVLSPDTSFGFSANQVFPALWSTWAVLLVCGFAAVHRAAFAPEDRLPYVPVLAPPRGLSLFEPLRMGLGHGVLLALAVLAVTWAPALVLHYLPAGWTLLGYGVNAMLILGVAWLSARFLTYPAQIAAESRLDPRASLRLSRGHTVQFFLAILIGWAAFAVLTGFYMGLCGYLVLPLSDGGIGSIDQMSLPALITLLIVLMIYAVLALGFWAGLSAAAYRMAVAAEV